MSAERATASVALEVNDVGLVLRQAGASRPEPESPGLALLDGERILVGAEAAARARTRPRFVNDTFWDRLDGEAVGRPFPAGVSRADLGHAHLQALAPSAVPGEAFLAVPGSWTAPALGLLLSVARAAGFPVVGVVDAAVAAASLGHPGERLLHLDLTRHRTVVTEMVQGDEVVRTRVAATDRVGWRGFEEAWAAAVASQFVRETRFDPLHHGDTEQALYDALPGWVSELGLRETLAVALSFGGREHQVELARGSLLAATADLYRALAEQVGLLKRVGEPATLLLSARAARLPRLADHLRAIRGLRVEELTLGAAVAGALEHREALRHGDGAVPLVARLPSGLGEAQRRVAPAPDLAPGAPGAPGTRPTHVLLEAVAYAIGPRGLAVGTAPPASAPALLLGGDTRGVSRHHCTLHAADGQVVVEDRSSWGTLLNGERVAGRAVVRAGDRVRVGQPGVELLLISVREGD